MDGLCNLIKHKDDEIKEAEDRPGPLDTEKIQRLKNEKKRSLEAEHQAKQKQFLQAQKDAKQTDKLQEEINKLTQRNRALDNTLNELKAKIDAIKPLDELNRTKKSLNDKSRTTSVS